MLRLGLFHLINMNIGVRIITHSLYIYQEATLKASMVGPA